MRFNAGFASGLSDGCVFIPRCDSAGPAVTVEFVLILFAVLLVVLWATLRLPAKPPPEKKIEVECPACKTKNERRCPNCGAELPKGSLSCKKCFLEAKAVPCKKSKADLRGMPH
jgi:hypothetical protein